MFMRPLRRRASSPPPPPDPALVSVNADEWAEVNCDFGGWVVRVRWTVSDPDPSNYRVDIQWSRQAEGELSWASLVDNLPGTTGTYDDATLVFGIPQPFGQEEVRRYRVVLRRLTPFAIVGELTTAPVSTQFDLCASP